MKAFFDTSVLVASFHESLPAHAASLQVVAGASAGCCSAHGLAEVYATLTGMLRPRRTGPAEAMSYIEDLRERFAVVGLTPEEYASALMTATRQGVAGGGVYDMLLARCALKAEADVLYTWNVRDFTRCGPEVARLVRTP